MSKSLTDFTLRSLRCFIGAKDYEISKQFYSELGFQVIEIDAKMCLIKIKNDLCFYLQDYYQKDWINNSMMFLEVAELDLFYEEILLKELPKKFKNVRYTEIKNENWGREFFMHDPSGVLWHFGNFIS